MGLAADGAVAHRTGLEAFENRLDGFDFLDGHGRRRFEIQQAAQRVMLLELVIHQLRVFLEDAVVRRANGVLELVNGLRAEEMQLAFRAPLILAADVERVAVDLAIRKRMAMTHGGFFGDDVERRAFDARGGPGEILVNDVSGQSDRFKDLRAAIALDGADAHFRGDLHDALDRRLHEVLAGGLVVDVLQHALMDHVVDGLEREIWIDRAAAVADEQREVMHLARFAGFQHQADAGAGAVADEMMMQAGDGQQRRDGRVVVVDAAVGENENVDAVRDGLVGRREERFHRLLQTFRAFRHLVEDG